MTTSRIAFVTGGTGGIGTAICRHLHDQGAQVVVGYLLEKGKETQQEEEVLKWQNAQAKENYEFNIVEGNVADFTSASKMIIQTEKNTGPIDILVNVAGITNDSTLKKMTQTQWEQVLQIDLGGIFNVTRQVIAGMMERSFGRIISISSVNAFKGNFGQTNYAAAKAGICGFSKSLALEVASKGITVNTVSPGYVDTSMVQKIPANVLEKIITQIPVGRLAQPDEIARVVAFLAHDKAAYITGSDIAVNGGVYMH